MLPRISTVIARSVFLMGVLACSPLSAAGMVSAYAAIDIGNLRFSFDDPDAVLVWDDDWFGTVTAFAQDTDSGAVGDYDDYLGNDGLIDAEAATAHVDSLATFEVVDGAKVAIEPDANVAAGARSNLYLEGKYKQADGLANADFDNFFFVSTTDPQAPASVLTTIELDYAGLLDAFANEYGYFEVFAGAFMELYETDAAGFDVTDLIDFDEFLDFAAGTNTAYDNAFSGTLTITAELLYDEVYWLYAEADGEVYGAVVPVIGTLPLLLIGAGALVLRRRGG